MGLILKSVPARDVVRQLRPWIFSGFIVIFLSGGLLFWSAAGRLLDSPAFPIKLALIVLAGANAAWFEFSVSKRPPVVGDPGRSAAGRAHRRLRLAVAVDAGDRRRPTHCVPAALELT